MLFDLPAEHPFSIVQLIGYVGMALGIFAFSQKDDLRMKIGMVVMTCVLIVHFMMLGSYVAAVASGLAGTRAALSTLPFARKHAHCFVAFFVIVSCVFSALTYEQWIDIFPFLTMISGTFALFYLHGLRLRYAFVCIGLLWLLHNAFAQSYGPLVMEFFILSANILTIIRLRRDTKKAAD